MPLLERVRVEAYVPDLPAAAYRNLLLAFEEEFTYAFGGCTVVRNLDGSYLSHAGAITPDRISLIYTDLPLALSTNFEGVARYADELKQAAAEALVEESILVAVTQVYHAAGLPGVDAESPGSEPRVPGSKSGTRPKRGGLKLTS